MPLVAFGRSLCSPIHEEQMLALLVLGRKLCQKEEVLKAYLRNLQHVNQWDLVDQSASYFLLSLAGHKKLLELSN